VNAPKHDPVQIHTTLSKLERAAHARGPAKARVVQNQRLKAQLRPSKGGGDFYAPAVAAVREGLLARNVPDAMRALLRQCTSAQHEHFREFTDGMLALLEEHHVVGAVRVPRRAWHHQDLAVTPYGLLGVRLASGEVQAWRLHKGADPLHQQDAAIPLHIVNAIFYNHAIEMTGVVVDVRRAAVFDITNEAQRAEARLLAETEAREYVTLWRDAA